MSVVVNWNETPGSPGPTDYPQGPPGATGATGMTGVRGSYWWQGSGVPTTTGEPVKSNDLYLDTLTGDVYAFS